MEYQLDFSKNEYWKGIMINLYRWIIYERQLNCLLYNYVLEISDLCKIFLVKWRDQTSGYTRCKGWVPFWNDISFFLVGEMLSVTALSVLVPVIKLMTATLCERKTFPAFTKSQGFNRYLIKIPFLFRFASFFSL